MHPIIVYIPESAQIEETTEKLRMHMIKSGIKDAVIMVVEPPLPKPCALVAEPDPATNRSIAERLRAHLIAEMPDIPVTIIKQKETSSGIITLQELETALMLLEIEEPSNQIKEFPPKFPDILQEISYQPDPVPYVYKPSKHTEYTNKRAMKQFNIINQRRKQFLSNKNKHK